MTVKIPNTEGDVHIGELTNAKLDGSGVFDVLMRAVKAHLKEEFDAGRIRATDYANVYLQSLTQVLDQASKYALAKSKLVLELQLLEAQIAKVATDTVVATKQGALIEAQTTTEQVNTLKVKADTLQTKEQTKAIAKKIELDTYELMHIKPKQLALLEKDILLKQNQIGLGTQEIALKTKQVALAEYDLTHIKPKELALKQNQIDLGLKEIQIKAKQIPLMEKDILLKQSQIDLGHKELVLKQKQVEVAQAEVEVKQQQVANAAYELRYKLPAEVNLIDNQSGLYGQKRVTEQAQTDSSVIGTGSVIYKQNNLLDEQSKTYFREFKIKAANIYADTWKVRNNSDPSTNTANSNNNLEDVNVGAVMKELGRELGYTSW